MTEIFAQRSIGPLASLDVTWRHVHRMLKLACKGLVHPVLKYGSSIWHLHSILLQDELDRSAEKDN